MSIDATFTTFPTLSTDRLRLRQVRPGDTSAFFATFGDAETMRYYGRDPMRTLDEAEELVAGMAARYAARQSIRWCLTRAGDRLSDDTVIGSCGFHSFDAGFHRAEIGYELNRAYWRQGLMTEAVAAVLTYGFTEMALHRIEAMIDIENEASKRLLEKLGFRYEGTLRERLFLGGDRFFDESCFSLLASEWQGVR